MENVQGELDTWYSGYISEKDHGPLEKRLFHKTHFNSVVPLPCFFKH